MVNTSMDKEWLTIAELQEWLSLGRTKAYEIASTEIPAYRVGRTVRLRRRDVEAWLEERRTQPGK